MAALSFKSYRGAEIESVFEALGKLRITVFRAWPYLYEGSLEYELDYLKTYSLSARSFLLAVFDDEEMVGATTCIPLADETAEVKEPFLKAGLGVESIFYFGESVLLPQYRGHGLGHRFFEEREAHANSFGSFKYTSFCGVVRPREHPARPIDYRPLDEFWMKRGYQPKPELQSQFEWLDIGDTSPSLKPMMYWMKSI